LLAGDSLTRHNLHKQETFHYDTGVFDFRGSLLELLELPDGTDLGRVHESSTIDCSKLIDKWNSACRQQGFYGTRFATTLIRFIREVVLPGMHCDSGSTLVYQARPSLRVQPPRQHGIRLHTDRDYYHQPAEVNWWVPLTPTFGSNTMWLESAPGAGDYRPQELAVGEVLRFYANACRHYTETNTTTSTRVSFDLRVCRGDMFDSDSPVSRVPGTGAQRFALGGYYAELLPAPGGEAKGADVAEGGEVQPRPRKPSKAWRVYRENFISQLMAELSLPVVVDDGAAAELEVALGDAARKGLAPSFAHAGARAGYTVKHLPARACHLANLLMLEDPPLLPRVRTAIFGRAPGQEEATETGSPVVVSIGGGPGFDAVGVAMVAGFLAAQAGQGAPGNATYATAAPCLPLTYVFDNEEGWEACVQAVQAVLVALEPFHSDEAGQRASPGPVRFATADILSPLEHPSNSVGRSAVAAADLLVFAHVVVENALGLQASGYAFLKGSLREAKPGAAFVFTDNTHRLWPAIVDVASQEGFFEASLPRVHGKHGHSLVLRKASQPPWDGPSAAGGPSLAAERPRSCTMEPYEMVLLDRFREDYARWAATRKGPPE